VIKEAGQMMYYVAAEPCQLAFSSLLFDTALPSLSRFRFLSEEHRRLT